MGTWRRLLALIGLHSVAPGVAAAQPPLEYQLWHADHVIIVRQQGNGQYSSYQPEQVLKGDKARLQWREEPALDVDDRTWRLLGYVPAPGRTAVMFLAGPHHKLPGHDITGLYPLDDQGRFTYAREDPTVRKTLTVIQLAGILNQAPFVTGACEEVQRIEDYLLCREVVHAGAADERRIGRLYHHGMEIPGKHSGQVEKSGPPDDMPLFIYRDNRATGSGPTGGWERVADKPR